MIRNMFCGISAILCFGFCEGLNSFASGQTQNPQNVVANHSDQYSMGGLRNDLRISDVVVYVDIKQKKLVDHTEGADCENDRGAGYCAYRLTADVKEVFKGDVQTKQIEFIQTSDAGYPKKYFMGEKVIFLEWSEPDQGETKALVTLENSTRSVDNRVLEQMRVVVNPLSAIDENDLREPYSKPAIQKSFADAQEVAYVDVTSFRADRDDVIGSGSIMTAVVKEVFKGGSLKVGQTINYRDDLVHRKHRKEDLGGQVIYLTIPNDNRFKRWKVDKATGKESFEEDIVEKGVIFVNEQYTEAFIKHNILEKLRQISSAKPKSK